MWKNTVTRFRTPKILISDNGLQFAENTLRDWCTDKGITQRFTSVAHPQANGQAEVSNKIIIMGLRSALGKLRAIGPKNYQPYYGHKGRH